MCPLTGSTAFVHAQVIMVEMRMNIFGPQKCPTSLWRATNKTQEESLPDSLISYGIRSNYSLPVQSFSGFADVLVADDISIIYCK